MRKIFSRIRVWLAKRISQVGSNMLTEKELRAWAAEKQAHADKMWEELCAAGWHEPNYGHEECMRCGKSLKQKTQEQMP
jgi:hypothetical protein